MKVFLFAYINFQYFFLTFFLQNRFADFLEAFKGHPKIGDVSSLAKKYANTTHIAANEQSGMNSANDQVIESLARGK